MTIERNSCSLRQKKLRLLNQTLFFSFSCSPCLSQSCLSRFGHQTLYTNIEGTRRHKSVPTILTETVVRRKEKPLIRETASFFLSFCVNQILARRQKLANSKSIHLRKSHLNLTNFNFLLSISIHCQEIRL